MNHDLKIIRSMLIGGLILFIKYAEINIKQEMDGLLLKSYVNTIDHKERFKNF